MVHLEVPATKPEVGVALIDLGGGGGGGGGLGRRGGGVLGGGGGGVYVSISNLNLQTLRLALSYMEEIYMA